MKPYLKYAGLGFEILASMLFCVGIGYWLDQKMETEKPWFVLGFALLGCVIVIYRMIQTLNNP
jgi:F0F1-type ATP synthase assembly protein I